MSFELETETGIRVRSAGIAHVCNGLAIYASNSGTLLDPARAVDGTFGLNRTEQSRVFINKNGKDFVDPNVIATAGGASILLIQ